MSSLYVWLRTRIRAPHTRVSLSAPAPPTVWLVLVSSSHALRNEEPDRSRPATVGGGRGLLGAMVGNVSGSSSCSSSSSCSFSTASGSTSICRSLPRLAEVREARETRTRLATVLDTRENLAKMVPWPSDHVTDALRRGGGCASRRLYRAFASASSAFLSITNGSIGTIESFLRRARSTVSDRVGSPARAAATCCFSNAIARSSSSSLFRKTLSWTPCGAIVMVM